MKKTQTGNRNEDKPTAAAEGPQSPEQAPPHPQDEPPTSVTCAKTDTLDSRRKGETPNSADAESVGAAHAAAGDPARDMADANDVPDAGSASSDVARCDEPDDSSGSVATVGSDGDGRRIEPEGDERCDGRDTAPESDQAAGFEQDDESAYGRPGYWHDDPHELGRRGEQAACAFLERRGFTILERNWKCRFGEVDIIARDEHALHFVEVKTRRGPKRGFPSEAVTDCKRARYERIAGAFLMDYEEVDIYVTFDVIGIMVTAPDRAFLRMTANAFSF